MNIKAIRGMNDILPEETVVWQYLENVAAGVLKNHGYQQIRLPIVEYTELFKRSIGEVTDIVEKEMYTFDDRNNESLTLRPEGTAGCVRACLENRLLASSGDRVESAPRRLWYGGPMFRYEKPQKGRQRQFHQIGVETFGMVGPDIDAEMLLMTARLWRALGIDSYVSLQVNSIGSSDARKRYRDALVAFLEQRRASLDEDSQRRLDTNPLRILDSKSPATQALLDAAPDLRDYLDDESRDHFAGVCKVLDAAGIRYEINPRLVRGLDYYCKTVFEWVTTHLGAQGTVCAGGRYDGLVEQLGGKATPAVGFAMGVERLCLLLEAAGAIPDSVRDRADIYVVVNGDEAVQVQAAAWTFRLRDEFPALRIVYHCGGGKFKSQFRKAEESGAGIALVIGDDEVRQQQINVKWMRDEGRGQQALSFEALVDTVRRHFFQAP